MADILPKHLLVRRSTNKVCPPNVKLMHRLAKATSQDSKWHLFRREYTRFHKIVLTLQEQGTYLDPRGRFQYTPETLQYMQRWGTIYCHFFGRVEYELDSAGASVGRIIVVIKAYREAQALLTKDTLHTIL
jgi:arginyl-tRNA--protein-N-Asp/Glu arginylyltransferase